MNATDFSNGLVNTQSLTWSGSAAPALAAYSYSAPSDSVDNTSNANQNPLSYRHGILRISFGTAQAATFNPPTRLGLLVIPLLDGINIASPPGPSAVRPAGNGYMLEQLLPGGAGSIMTYSIVDFGSPNSGFNLGPFKYAFQLYNGTQNVWTVAPTVTLYRWDSVLGTPTALPATTLQATMVIPANISTDLIAANATLAPNSASIPTPGVFGITTIENTGTNMAFVAWFGGPASASGGSIPIPPGGSKTMNLSVQCATQPAIFSPLGTTVAIYN